MMHRKWSLADIKGVDMVDFLEALGYTAQKIRGQDYWYLSPLRTEKHPSFKVARHLNLWYDHGIGKGGNLVDFCLQFNQCSVRQLLARFQQQRGLDFSFHPHLSTVQNIKQNEAGKIHVLEVKGLHSRELKAYLKERGIPLSIADRYLHEVDFELYGKRYTTLGFPNSSGGYELRSRYFKGSSSPKEVTHLTANGSELLVFEGFFNFLSYQALAENSTPKQPSILPNIQGDFLVLNSLSFLEKSCEKMEAYQNVHLFFDRDEAGIKATEKALKWSPKYQDQSHCYRQFKDLNEQLVQLKFRLSHQQTKGLSHRRHF